MATRKVTGYMSLQDVYELLSRIGERMNQLDEPLAREYVLDPFPGGIEQKIHQMCQRRKVLYERLARVELHTRRDRMSGSARPKF